MFENVITREGMKKMTKQLESLPKTLREKFDTKTSKITYEGLSAKLGTDLNDLVVHKPTNGLTFSVMFYDHDEFNDRYEVYPHKVNFGKDRKTLQIGSTQFSTKIKRYVKDTRVTYTLQLKKGQLSPLFVPYKDDIFLVLEPLNPIQTVEPAISVTYGKSMSEMPDDDDGEEVSEKDPSLEQLFAE